jgi:Cu/Ag efflux protein CusF
MSRTRILSILFLSLLLAACGGSKDAAAAAKEKRYDLRGEVTQLDAANQVATIKHEKLGDWMDAMTMEFPVKPKSEFNKLSPGAQITGVVIVNGMDYHVTDIKVIAKKTEPAK